MGAMADELKPATPDHPAPARAVMKARRASATPEPHHALRGFRATIEQPCPDCAVPPGTFHDAGCDVARCLETGHQRLSCEGEHDCGHDTWDGTWPGRAEAEQYGVDLNTLMGSGRFVWDRTVRRWMAPIRTPETFTIVIPVITDEITMEDMCEAAPLMWRDAVEDAGGTPYGEPTVERVSPLVDHAVWRSPGVAWAVRVTGPAIRG